MFQVYLTGMVPLAIRPHPPKYLNFSYHYVSSYELGRFEDKESWRTAIFGHVEKSPELSMLRLWQCVEANHEGVTGRRSTSLRYKQQLSPTNLRDELRRGKRYDDLLRRFMKGNACKNCSNLGVVRGHSRSSAMSPFDRGHTTS